KPAVIAVIVAAVWRVGRRAVRTPLHGVLAAAALAALQFGLGFPWVIVGAAIAGLVVHRVGGAAAASPHGAAASSSPSGSARPLYVLDDDTPTPAHARPSKARTLRLTLAALLLWAAVEGAVVLATGRTSTLTEMGLFFTLAAFVTFGGAYAV